MDNFSVGIEHFNIVLMSQYIHNNVLLLLIKIIGQKTVV